MSALRKTARDVSIVGGSHLVMWAATFVFTVAQARYLGPARFGELSLALAYAALFTIVVDFGLSTQLSRLVAQRASDLGKMVGATLVLRVALWLLTLPFALLTASLLGYGQDLREAILILGVSVFFMGLSNTIGAILQGREQFFLLSVAAIAYRVTAAAVGVSLLMVTQDIGVIAGAFVLASLAAGAVLLFGMRAGAAVPVEFDARTTLEVLRGAIPLGLYWIVGTFYFSVDMVMLERLAPADNVGWYAAAYRLFSTTLVVPGIVTMMVLFPMFSRLSVDSRDELRRVIDKAFTFLVPVGCAVAVAMAVLAEAITSFVYPSHSYGAAANALRLLAPGVLLVYVNSVFAYALLGLHHERRLLAMAMVAAVLNPLANLIAIPLWQQDGAALTTSLTEVFLLVWLVFAMPRDLLSGASVRLAARSMAAGAITAAAIFPVRELSLLLTLPAALAVYAAAALALRVISPNDLRALAGVVRHEPHASPPRPVVRASEEVA
jgi:O-antigen/teichoic acid export membrane protein